MSSTGAAQAIFTVAGTGSQGSSINSISATATQLSSPYGVAVDGSGNLYISDNGNNRILKVTYTHAGLTTFTSVSIFAGGGTSLGNGTATSAKLSNPKGIALDNAGNLYIADYGNNIVREVTGGIINTIAGSTSLATYSGDGGLAISAGLNGPSAVAVSSSGNVYIADVWENRIRRVSNGYINTAAGNGTAGNTTGVAISSNINLAQGIAVDGSGNLYIPDYENGRICEVALGTTIASTNLTANVTDEQINSFQAKLYPNPSHGIATLELQGGKSKLKVTVTGLLGNQVGTYEVTGNTKLQLPADRLAGGLYVVTITDATGIRKTLKWMNIK